MLRNLTAPVEQLDSERLREFAAGLGCTPIGEAEPRREVTVGGEISSVRIVPRAGSPSLEATVTDGTGYLTAVWTGRRRIAVVGPGRRIRLTGRGAPIGPAGRLL